jgi:hypothetical protein
VRGWLRRTRVDWECVDHVALGQATPWLIVRLRGTSWRLRVTVEAAPVGELSERLLERLGPERLDPLLGLNVERPARQPREE